MRKQYDMILFDLDGTITQSDMGITNSIQYSLKYFGIEKDTDSLKKHIGPPLGETFREYVGNDEKQVKLAIDKYREYYAEKGIFENIVYDGVEDTLKKLKEQNKTIVLASSKPKVYCERILEHFNLDKYFDFIAGSNLDETRNAKSEVIEYALENVQEMPKDKILMVGDREHDILGSRSLGIESVGVLYGYGGYEELKESNANYIIKEINELFDIIL